MQMLLESSLSSDDFLDETRHIGQLEDNILLENSG